MGQWVSVVWVWVIVVVGLGLCCVLAKSVVLLWGEWLWYFVVQHMVVQHV